MKKTFAFILGVAIVLCSIQLMAPLVAAAAPNTPELALQFFSGSEPDEGVNGIIWGTNVALLKNMEFFQAGQQYQETEEFRMKEQNLVFSDVQLQDIRYCFWRGLLYRVIFVTNDADNWTKLKAIVGNRYPEFLQPTEIEVVPGVVTKTEKKNRHHFKFQGMEMDDWRSERIYITADYRHSSGRGILVLESKKMIEQIERAQKAK